MKRVISLLLCMVMCVSVFSATATQVYAVGQVKEIFSVEKTDFENDSITYTLSLAPNQENLIGAIIKVDFDDTVLEVSSESGPTGTRNNYGDFVADVSGYYEQGITCDGENDYSIAYMNPNGFDIGESGKSFITVTFNAISEERPVTEVKFYCEEYITEDEDDSNDIKRADGSQLIYSDSFFTLNPANNLEVASTETGLRFTWTEATGAEQYNIYRRTENTEWALFTTVDAGITEYNDETIEEGIEYYYSVESANKYGVREYDKTGLVGMNFGTITEIGSTLTERGALISWGALTNAASYTVYRKADGETSWKKIADTTETSYEDEPLTSGVTYSYTVKAHHEKGYVAETSVDPTQITFIANAVILEYQLNYMDIVINWLSVDGAASYEIYRKATDESDYTCIATVSIPGYIDEDVNDGESYSYQVRSVMENGVGSVRGEDSFDLVKLPITTEVVAASGSDGVTVSWAPVELAENYIILRRDNNSSNWFTVATVKATETKYTDVAVNSGKTYTYSVKTKAGNLETNISNPSNSVYYLVAPKIAEVKNGSKGMEINIEKVNGADYYNIYRRLANGQFGEPIGTLTNGDSLVYVDSTAVSGVQYVYGVQAVHEDVFSAITSSSLACRLEEPNVTIKNTYSGIQLTWNTIPGAEKYIVYYGGTSSKVEKLEALGSTTSTSYVYDKGYDGRNNYFAVEAVCGETASTKALANIYHLKAPVKTSLDNGIGQVTFRWTELDCADSYLVYRKKAGDTKWTKLTSEPIEATSYKDTTVVSGTTYIYTVKGYDGEEYTPYNSSGWSIQYLATPKISSVTNAYGGVKVSWGKTGASKYYVYRKTKSETKWTYLGSTESTSFLDKTPKSNTKYYYAVRSIGSSSKSFYSYSHFCDVCKSVQYLAAPVPKVSNSTSGTKISWSKITGAKQYVVFRKAGSANSWTKIATITGTSYTDKNVKSGTNYKYTVRAYNGSLSSGYHSGVAIKFLSAPTLSSVSSSKSGVTFKWNKVSGASGYYVYRKTGSGEYTKIATVKGNTKVSYLDKSAKKGTTYYYTVRAYYGSYTSGYKSPLKITDKY
ncbi:MAG: hypothetical protein ACI4VW_05835 [Acutalibacteraceae bacterium]